MKNYIYDTEQPESHTYLGKQLRELPKGKYLITVKKHRIIRSLDQNKYYWAIIKIIGIHTGYDQDTLHELFKSMFNFIEIKLPNGDIRRVGQTTSDLDTDEFTRYINQVKQYGRDDFGCIIPEKQDVTYLQWMEIDNEYTKARAGY